MISIPLILDPATNFATIDYDKVEFICNTQTTYPGDLRIIKTGDETNNFLIMDWSNQLINILDIDDATG